MTMTWMFKVYVEKENGATGVIEVRANSGLEAISNVKHIINNGWKIVNFEDIPGTMEEA